MLHLRSENKSPSTPHNKISLGPLESQANPLRVVVDAESFRMIGWPTEPIMCG